MSALTKSEAQARVSEAQRDADRDMHAAPPGLLNAAGRILDKVLATDPPPATDPGEQSPPPPAVSSPPADPGEQSPPATDPAPGLFLSSGAPVPPGWTVCNEPGRAGFYDDQGRYRWPSGKLYWSKSGEGMSSSPRAPRATSNGVASGERKVSVSEAGLLALATDLTSLQAALATFVQTLPDGVAPPVLAHLTQAGDVAGDVATRLTALVNPFKARAAEIEQSLGDTEIALAEAQLTLARATATHMRIKRASGPEAPDALAAGAAVNLASVEVDRLTRERNQLNADYTRAMS